MAIQAVTPPVAGLDYQAIATAVAGVVAFTGVVIAGLRQGLKIVRELKPVGNADGTVSTIQAASVIETASMRDWAMVVAEANRSTLRLVEATDDSRREMKDLVDELRDIRRTLDELHRKLG